MNPSDQLAPDPPLLDREQAAYHCLAEVEICRSLVLMLEELEVSTWGRCPSVLVRPASLLVPPREGYSPTALLQMPIGEYTVSQVIGGPNDGGWLVTPESMNLEECVLLPGLDQALAYLIEHAGASYAIAEIEQAAEDLGRAAEELNQAIQKELRPKGKRSKKKPRR